MSDCPFCRPSAERLFLVTPDVVGMWDAFPVNPGHALLVPKRHVASWFEATPEERDALVRATDGAKREIERLYKPDGYNIGINIGATAGQTIFHLHVHVIPRYLGDVTNPRGGVRGVVPSKRDYTSALDRRRDPASGPIRLIHGGDEEPLLPHIETGIATAAHVDIAVAFTLQRGVQLLYPHFEDLLARGGRLRFLTGDYRGCTEPEALRALLDLTGDVHLRVFETGADPSASAAARAFHPKSYLFYDERGVGTAFVGSSNVSDSALRHGIEWNYRITSPADEDGFAETRRKFDALFTDARVQPLTYEWISGYDARRSTVVEQRQIAEVTPEPIEMVQPHDIQTEALEALEATRIAGNTAGLVVLATGLGKTWLSVFDSRPFRRVLFVAHREEILNQARHTFRRVRPNARLGLYTGTERDGSAEVVFASIQTLGRQNHLDRFSQDEFDYIVVDEFHHASATTYRRLIQYFRPKFLLGLTATPERSDGGNLLALCGENLVYRCDLAEAIRRTHLAPFHYFGVPDDVDYSNIPWRNGRFDEETLTTAVATKRRAENALDQWKRRGGGATIAFCVSQRHADFMAGFLRESGVRSVAVHAGSSSAPRALSLEQLQDGSLDILCAVDMFNEGVDVPTLSTVLMLRPTESRILWLQQIGRGLRKAEGKTHLNVIDYIGNHRAFLMKPQTLFDLPSGRQEILNFLERYEAGALSLPPGCEVTYDLETVEILRKLVQPLTGDLAAFRRYYEDFRESNGERPTAAEAFHDGYSPRSVRSDSGSWLAFVRSMGDLGTDDTAVLSEHGDLLAALDTTEMSRSYKMVVLLAMLNVDALPGRIEVDHLVEGVTSVATRNAHLRQEFGDLLRNPLALKRMLQENPIAAWTGGRGTGGRAYFTYDDSAFAFADDVNPAHRAAFQRLMRELVEWRLAEYVTRASQPADEQVAVCKVSHSGGRPIIFLDREKNPALPEGTVRVVIDGTPHEVDFVKVAVNVARSADGGSNALPSLLRNWFGPDAGLPGTRQAVIFRREGDEWQLTPEGRREAALQRWRSYSREQIPPLFGMQFTTAVWNVGYVARSGHIFLLVTLDKSGHTSEFQYGDRFIDATTFEWQSQNRTTQAGRDGATIRNHEAAGTAVHLFVRAAKKDGSRSAPFVYCGDVAFVGWHGNAPVTVTWKLAEAVPERLRQHLRVPASAAPAFPFTIVDPAPGERFRTAVPLISLRAAAHDFSEEQLDVEVLAEHAEQWVMWPRARPFEPGMFVAQVEGRSMEPGIPDGCYVLFRPWVGGSREGRRLLVRHAGIEDSETGGQYTVKLYSSEKVWSEDGSFSHRSIVLKPMNPEFAPVVLTAADDGDVRVIGEVWEVLSPGQTAAGSA